MGILFRKEASRFGKPLPLTLRIYGTKLYVITPDTFTG